MQTCFGAQTFGCRPACKHKECQRHANIGGGSRPEDLQCLGNVPALEASSVFLENVVDLAHTLAQIMILCGIHECKANSSVDVTTYAFLHYDQVCYCLDAVPKKRLRKEDIFHELGKKCLMNRVEAHLAYSIIKRGFKAFYYKPEEHQIIGNQEAPSFSEECVYVHAAKKTAESFARYEGLSCCEQLAYEAKIKLAYKKYYDRMITRRNQPVDPECNCCFCTKKRGHMVYAKAPPCDQPEKKKKHKCPYCCKKIRKKIHAGRQGDKCPKCHRLRKYCICEKYQFMLEWVKSIWERPDFSLYYKETIEKATDKEQRTLCDGNSWFAL